MSIRAIITTLLLGSSAVASARPVSAWDYQREQRELRERERLAHERDAFAQRDRLDRERLGRERVQLDRYRDRDRWERERIARLERDRIVDRERQMRLERERRFERERFERMWWQRDHRYRSGFQVDPGYYGRTWYRPGYVSLIAPTALVEGRMFVSIAPELGTLNTIRLDGTGLTFVQKIVVECDNGVAQAIPVDQWLDGSTPIELAMPQLNGCPRRIIVYGQSQYGGQIAVTAA